MIPDEGELRWDVTENQIACKALIHLAIGVVPLEHWLNTNRCSGPNSVRIDAEGKRCIDGMYATCGEW